MPADASLRRAEGIVEEALPALAFKVRLTTGEVVHAHLAGKMRLHHIRIVRGDRVQIDVTPDGARGRISRRL